MYYKDLTGQRSGMLTAVRRLDEKKGDCYLWECRCDCGGTKLVSSREFKHVTSCGCRKGLQRYLEGQKFGKLTVIRDSGEKQKNVKLWLCQCDCGNMVKVRTDSLTGGKTTSCGCSKRSDEKVEKLKTGRKLEDHTSPVFFNGTLSKNSSTGINGICYSRGKYIATIGYKNKNYTLYQGKYLQKAIDTRQEAEEHLFKDFESWWKERKKRNERNNRFNQ